MIERVADGEEAGRGVARGQAAPSRPPRPRFDKKTIALVYDFDGTLSPRPMQDYAFLPKIGEDAAAFWKESNRLAKEQGADHLITYMHLLYKKAKAKGVRIDRDDLVRQGRNVELYAGVEDWFDAIGAYVKLRSECARRLLRHYLVSSGLTEIIEGTTIYKRFHNVFASSTGSTPTTCRSPSASSPTPARRSTCSASTRASRTWARTSTSTCRRRRGPFPSPT